MTNDDPIPLEEGELSGSIIIPDSQSGLNAPPAVRCRRRNLRKSCGHCLVCLSREFDSGKVDHAECPVINISTTGIAVEYDEAVPIGAAAALVYRSVSGRPVHVGATVRQCRPLGDGRFLVGIQFDRKLRHDEDKPAHIGPGREVAPGIRTRKLRTPARN